MPVERYQPDPVAENALRTLGEHVSAWRKLHLLTQQQMATRAGVSKPVITRLERGDAGVGIGALMRVLIVIGIENEILTALDPYQTRFGRELVARTQVQRVRKPPR
ncbi:MAG: helix-turn-helix transcriptional regulator [Micropruina sp.]|nr:helix-turn-helix transcriptional regulator [Micropruina sp.]